jgi:hypothetical protein
MTTDERAAFDALPETVEVWRGCHEANKWGLSWSLDKEVASRFPTLSRFRGQGQPLLVRAKLRKSKIIAVKLGRDEQEIVAWQPKHVATRHLLSSQQ